MYNTQRENVTISSYLPFCSVQVEAEEYETKFVLLSISWLKIEWDNIQYTITFFILMVSTEASWWNILTLKIHTTLGYIVSLILLKKINLSQAQED